MCNADFIREKRKYSNLYYEDDYVVVTNFTNKNVFFISFGYVHRDS